MNGILIGTVLSVLLPAALYSYVENWSYLESVYFCFITISTIGFGDYIPSNTAISLIEICLYFGPVFRCEIVFQPMNF